MRVRCLASRPTSEQLQQLEFDRTASNKFDVTPGKEYLVLAMRFLPSSSAFGAGATLEIIDDFDRWALAPLIIFEIVNPRLSQCWVATKLESSGIALWPHSFSKEHYHEDLTEGVLEVVADFKRVRALIEAEETDSHE